MHGDRNEKGYMGMLKIFTPPPPKINTCVSTGLGRTQYCSLQIRRCGS
jgi:hypothetical protein